MKQALAAALLLFTLSWGARAHDISSTVSWNREISRILYDRCASCHRPGGSAFSLMTYGDVQPRAVEIKEAVLSRRMPPWGAVKGFGNFRNDQGLMQEQIELITRWVESGTRRGNNPQMLPKEPTFAVSHPFSVPTNAVRINGDFTLGQALNVDGLLPEKVPPRSIKVVAALPGGSIEPLIWLYEYDDRYQHPFLFRKARNLPAGTMIRGVPPDAVIALIPVAAATTSPARP